MNTYYYSDSSDEIETILRDGFLDNMEEPDTGRLGVYVGDSPGEPDPAYPDDQLLEITLPGQIDNSNWRLVCPENPCRWKEWLIPARILNKHARVRQLRKDQWEQAWTKYKDAEQLRVKEAAKKQWDALVGAGLIIVATDSEGRPVYRNGQLVYKLSEKGQRLAKHGRE
jgi:hypothetical protein